MSIDGTWYERVPSVVENIYFSYFDPGGMSP